MFLWRNDNFWKIESIFPFFPYLRVSKTLLKHRLLPWSLFRVHANWEKIRTLSSFKPFIKMITWWRKEFQNFVPLAPTHRHWDGPEGSPVIACNCHLCCKKHPILFCVARKKLKYTPTEVPKCTKISFKSGKTSNHRNISESWNFPSLKQNQNNQKTPFVIAFAENYHKTPNYS